MNKKRKDKIKDIPHGDYCYHSGVKENGDRNCPFYISKLSDSGLNFKMWEQGYCKFIHSFLSIDDQIKDCKINLEYDDE